MSSYAFMKEVTNMLVSMWVLFALLPTASPPTSGYQAMSGSTTQSAALSTSDADQRPELRVYMSGSYWPLHELKNGVADGFEADLARLLAEHLDRRLVFVSRSDTGLDSMQSVAQGKADIALNAITPTPERSKVVSFTDPYVQVEYWLVAAPGSASTFDRQALSGARIGVPLGPTESAKEGFLEGATHVPVPSVDKGVAQLGKGIDFLLAEAPAVYPYVAKGKASVVWSDAGSSPLAMAVPKGSERRFNEALEAVRPEAEKRWAFWRAEELYLHLIEEVVSARDFCLVLERTDTYAKPNGSAGSGHQVLAGDVFEQQEEKKRRVALSVRGSTRWIEKSDVVCSDRPLWKEVSSTSEEIALDQDNPCGTGSFSTTEYSIATTPEAEKLKRGYQRLSQMDYLSRQRFLVAAVGLLFDGRLEELLIQWDQSATCEGEQSKRMSEEGAADGCDQCGQQRVDSGAAAVAISGLVEAIHGGRPPAHSNDPAVERLCAQLEGHASLVGEYGREDSFYAALCNRE